MSSLLSGEFSDRGGTRISFFRISISRGSDWKIKQKKRACCFRYCCYCSCFTWSSLFSSSSTSNLVLFRFLFRFRGGRTAGEASSLSVHRPLPPPPPPRKAPAKAVLASCDTYVVQSLRQNNKYKYLETYIFHSFTTSTPRALRRMRPPPR